MNLKRAGKRMLYLVGGIIIVLVSLIILIAILDTGARWYDQFSIYLYVAIIFGVTLIVSGFSKNIDGGSQKAAGNKINDTGTNKM